ncbi:MAG: NADH-ubiquinone oxidoreductase-F iron-sulfur binding region domain-containing protein [Actinomycetota bacterium]
MAPFLLPPEPVGTLAAYLETDVGGRGLERAVAIGPEATIEELTRSGLRGRGGAGFPTGRKWASVAGQPGTHHYVVANAAEGEPGTFKDRALMRANPYQLVEGLIIGAFAVGAAESFIGLKASFKPEIEAITRAVVEMQDAGLCRDCTVTIVQGPDEYLFGEEKALLEVIEGGEPLPRLLPPHEHGLFATAPQLGWESKGVGPGHAGRHESNPTLVNNVETFSNVPHVLARGAEWFRTIGTRDSPGNVVATVVGDVVAPDVGEVEFGTPLRAVIDAVGSGMGSGRSVKAVISGVANPVLTSDQLDLPLSYEDLSRAGGGMGAAGFVVYDDTACMVEVARQVSRFLYVESCGQCPACKRGTGEITARLERIEGGVGVVEDLVGIAGWLDKVTDGNRCYLPVEEQVVVASIIRAFTDEFEEHLRLGACPRPRPLPFPKLIDLTDGRATYDPDQWRKQPDWTYR